MYKSIMDIAPKQALNADNLCICDKCKKTFDPKDTLMEKADNIQFAGILGVKGITREKHTYYLVSPCCKEVHLFGFNLTDTKIG